MTVSKHPPVIQHFLAHQRLWSVGLLTFWATLNIVVLATSVILEDRRDDATFAIWEPFCWEATSLLMVVILIPALVYVSDRFLIRLSIRNQLIAHLLLTIPVSAIHVAGMVGLRKLCYSLVGWQYHFGQLPYEFIYEYRKDFQAYLTLGAVIAGYRFIVRRLHGEASVIREGEDEPTPQTKSPERLLVKKLGKEFLVNVEDIEWIEAAGNYANLHVGSHLYPMRVTMTKLEQTLPQTTFARIHRSYIVNLNQVKTLKALETGDYDLTLENGKQLALSRRYRERFKESFG